MKVEVDNDHDVLFFIDGEAVVAVITIKSLDMESQVTLHEVTCPSLGECSCYEQGREDGYNEPHRPYGS